MSFETALTGINAASTELNVISNNIANNATSGFKSSRVEFADVYAQSAGSTSTGNVGQGVRVASVRQEHTQGDMQFTERNLDIAVEGLGLFKLSDNDSTLYTRSGNFGIDREGYIVNTEGAKLTGFGVDDDNEILPITTDLQIDYSNLEPNPSTKVTLAANLSTTATQPVEADGTTPLTFDSTDPDTYNFSTSTLVYDSLGSSSVASIYFQKEGANTWKAFPVIGDDPIEVGSFDLDFATSGFMKPQSTDPDAVVEDYGPVTFSPDGATDMSLSFDLSAITQFEDAFGVNKIDQDGYSAGRLEDFDIDTLGVISGRYSNGEAKTMGQVTLSNFSNESGLQQVGTTSWKESYASGAPATGAPGSSSLGKLQSGALEGSNVDITQELVSMITAQRSFQANAKVISTGDTITQTVINIGR